MFSRTHPVVECYDRTGRWHTWGQLGDNTTTHRDTPTLTALPTVWRSVSAGLGHTLALRATS